MERLTNKKEADADNLQEAISCFIGDGEYNITGIMKEVMRAYGMGEGKDNEVD